MKRQSRRQWSSAWQVMYLCGQNRDIKPILHPWCCLSVKARVIGPQVKSSYLFAPESISKQYSYQTNSAFHFYFCKSA